MAETKGQCSAMVFEAGLWGAFHPHPCHNKAVVVRDGKGYCKIHDPEYIKARRDKSDAEYRERVKRKSEQRELEVKTAAACKAVNPSNPLAVASQIEALFTVCEKIMCLDDLTPLESMAYSGGDVPKKWLKEEAPILEARSKYRGEIKEMLRLILSAAKES